MAQNKKLIPVERLERWLKKALEILKDGGRPGRYQTGLLNAVRNGTDMPADEFVDSVFLTALAAQKNVGKISDGLNPKWRLSPVKICDVVIPQALEGVMYQAAVAEALPAEVTMADVVGIVGPAVRKFMKVQLVPVTKAQLLEVAKEALGGRDFPESLFGRLCYIGHVTRRDLTKDEYSRAGGTRGPRKASVKKDSPVQPQPQKKRGRPPKKAVQSVEASVVVQKPVVITLEPNTKLEVSPDQKLFILKGDMAPLLNVVELPFNVIGNMTEVQLTSGELASNPDMPCVLLLNGGSIRVELSFYFTLKVGRIQINGPFSQIIFKHIASYQ